MWKRIPFLLLVLAGLAFWWFSPDKETLQNVQLHLQGLHQMVASSLLLASLLYLGLYALSTALSLPWASFLTLVGGFLFGAYWGTLLTVVGATLGAVGIFLAARSACRDFLRKRAGSRLSALQEGFHKNAFSYLLFLRLVPFFPFFLVNIAPAFFGMRLRPYALATFLGIVPATFVFSLAGSGLQTLSTAQGSFSTEHIFTPEILLSLTGLGFLSLLPSFVKRWKTLRKAGK